VFSVWETIWAASRLVTEHFQLFIALSIISSYRNIILDNCMDFTEIIKFFNGLFISDWRDNMELFQKWPNTMTPPTFSTKRVDCSPVCSRSFCSCNGNRGSDLIAFDNISFVAKALYQIFA
jgi:hypothetical protein